MAFPIMTRADVGLLVEAYGPESGAGRRDYIWLYPKPSDWADHIIVPSGTLAILLDVLPPPYTGSRVWKQILLTDARVFWTVDRLVSAR